MEIKPSFYSISNSFKCSFPTLASFGVCIATSLFVFEARDIQSSFVSPCFVFHTPYDAVFSPSFDRTLALYIT